MKVREAIKILQTMKPDSDMKYLYDGGVRANANVIYESKSGEVVVADNDMVVYDDEDRPLNAPLSDEVKYWNTKSK